MKLRKLLIPIIIISLFVFIIIIGYVRISREINLLSIQNQDLANRYFELEDEKIHFNEITNLQYEISFKKIENLALITLNNTEAHLGEIVTGGEIIFFFDYKKVCQVCLEQTMMQFEDLERNLNAKSVILVTNYSKARDLRVLKSKYNLSSQLYNIKSDWSESFEDIVMSGVNQIFIKVNEELEIQYSLPITSRSVLDDRKIRYLKKVIKQD